MRLLLICLSFLIFASCQKSNQQKGQVVEKSDLSIAKRYSKGVEIQERYASRLTDWEEYKNVSEFISRFTDISPNEALGNSKELNELVKSMNDSIKPEFLDNQAFNARLNLIYNETLRLYDMSTISAIKADEVNNQVSKVLESFSSVNAKINTIILQTNLDNGIEDPDFKRAPFDQNTLDSNEKETANKKVVKKKKGLVEDPENPEKINTRKRKNLKERKTKLNEVIKKKKKLDKKKDG